MEKLSDLFVSVRTPLTIDPRYLENGPVLYQHHCRDSAMPYIRKRHAEGVPIITTHRNPTDTERGYMRRYKSIETLAEFRRNWPEVHDLAAFVIVLDGDADGHLELIRAAIETDRRIGRLLE